MDESESKKKGLAALVIAMKPKGEKAEDKVKDADKGFAVAAEEAFKAAKDDDKAAFAKALKNAIKLCVADYEKGEDE